MQIQVDIGFKDLVEIVKNLPKSKLLELKKELEKEAQKPQAKEIRELLLNGPVFSEKQLETIAQTRKEINKWRTN